MATRRPGLLARGPVDARPGRRPRWREEHARARRRARPAAADAAIAALRERGSPSHDGLAARLAGYERATTAGCIIELQPARWALRLVDGDASRSVAALCVVRDADGRWLAGRRAPWVASWAGRWALGAGGAVEVGESPADTLVRELEEEWSVAPERAAGRGARPRCRTGWSCSSAWRGCPAGAEVVARRTSTTRTPGGRPTSRAGRTRPTSRCGAWRALLGVSVRASDAPAQPVVRRLKRAVVHPLGDLRCAAVCLARPAACSPRDASSAGRHGLGWIVHVAAA